MGVFNNAVARSWGECMWTSRDLLKQSVTVTVHPAPPPDSPDPRRFFINRRVEAT